MHPSNSAKERFNMDCLINILELSWWSLLVGGAEGATPNLYILYTGILWVFTTLLK